MKAIFYILISIFSLTAFGKECILNSPVKVFRPQYAQHFYIEYFNNFKIVHVGKNQYLLSRTKDLGCEVSMNKIITPVKKVVMMSTTYLPGLTLINQEKSLIAFQGKNYIVSKNFKLDQVKEVSFKFNTEHLLGLNADLVMGYEENLTSENQREMFDKLKIPVVMNKDFEESSPLGRAEWLIYIASFYDQEDKAIEIFTMIKNNYLSLKLKNQKTATPTSVLVGEIQNGKWVTCGGKSDFGQMVEDAGGVLAFKRPSVLTQSISLEEFTKNKGAFDTWLTHNSWTSINDKNKALRSDTRYLLVKAKKVYNNNLISNKFNSNDFWESGLQRPDLLLLDLSIIFHPENYRDQKPRWYQKL